MKKLALLALLCTPLFFTDPMPASADVYVMKTGLVVEGKTTKIFQKKIPGQGGPKTYYVIQKEDGKEEEICEKDLAYAPVIAKPSWEVRKANQDWYAVESLKVKDEWKAHETFAKTCRTKRYLEPEVEKEYKKAYELRKPEIKDEIDAHRSLATQLENEWELYDAAKTEWRWVYNKKREAAETPGKLVDLAKWCLGEGLYDEAADAYGDALKVNPEYKDAKKGLKRLENSPKVNSQFYRALYNRLGIMVGLLESKRKPDGSYGSDVTEAAVHGHLGMTSLVGLSLLAKWDFAVMKDASAMDACPGSLKGIMPYIIQCNEKGKIPVEESKDVWGPVWRLEFLAQAYKHDAIGEALKKLIVKRTDETFKELRELVRPDGGWAYYEFVPEGITFVTACCVVAMCDCKEAGLPIDETMLQKACDSVEAARVSKGLYGYHHQGGGESEVGCCGRSSLCEYSLIRAGRGDKEALQVSVDNFFKNRHLLEAIKDIAGTHIGKGMTAPYYYLFGHYWTARAIHSLPREKWTDAYKKLRDILFRNMKPNGELTDTPLTKDNEVYGTAFGALWAYQMAIDEWKMKKDDDDDGKPGDKPADTEKKTPTPGK